MAGGAEQFAAGDVSARGQTPDRQGGDDGGEIAAQLRGGMGPYQGGRGDDLAVEDDDVMARPGDPVAPVGGGGEERLGLRRTEVIDRGREGRVGAEIAGIR